MAQSEDGEIDDPCGGRQDFRKSNPTPYSSRLSEDRLALRVAASRSFSRF